MSDVLTSFRSELSTTNRRSLRPSCKGKCDSLMKATGRCLHGQMIRALSVFMVATMWLQHVIAIRRIFMTSEERHELRYQRRKQYREAQRAKRNAAVGNFNEIFSMEHLYKAWKASRKGVGWKCSVQEYKANALDNIYCDRQRLLNGTYRSKGFVEFDLIERGKPRHIRSVHISERVIQRCLCDYALIPLLSSTFIYDNGASLKGKGIDFSMQRLVKHLHQYYNKYGTNEGYVLTFDFSKYFDSANHAAVFQELRRCITDQDVLRQTEYFIKQFGDQGLGLGSQVSQICALALPNRIDHFVKEKLGIKYYARYMDDGYMIHPSKQYLTLCLYQLQAECDKLGIKLNPKKTQIAKLSNGVNFLKGLYVLNKHGGVWRKLSPISVTTMRRKLKKFARWLAAGRMSLDDIRVSVASWAGHAHRFHAYRSICNIKQQFRAVQTAHCIEVSPSGKGVRL